MTSGLIKLNKEYLSVFPTVIDHSVTLNWHANIQMSVIKTVQYEPCILSLATLIKDSSTSIVFLQSGMD